LANISKDYTNYPHYTNLNESDIDSNPSSLQINDNSFIKNTGNSNVNVNHNLLYKKEKYENSHYGGFNNLIDYSANNSSLSTGNNITNSRKNISTTSNSKSKAGSVITNSVTQSNDKLKKTGIPQIINNKKK